MTTKTFDAVKLMRELRQQLGEELDRVDPSERLQYVRDKAATTDLGRKLAADSQNSTE